MQAGYGVWFGQDHHRNIGAHVPVHERQSSSRGELRGVLHALLSRSSGEHLVVVMDSEWDNNMVRRHGWRTSTREVGHRDLWEDIWWLREEAGDLLRSDQIGAVSPQCGRK